MNKKAYLVKVSFVTRVIMDKDLPANEKEASIISQVRKNILAKIDNGEISENITDMRSDKEMPYNPEYDEH